MLPVLAVFRGVILRILPILEVVCTDTASIRRILAFCTADTACTASSGSVLADSTRSTT